MVHIPGDRQEVQSLQTAIQDYKVTLGALSDAEDIMSALDRRTEFSARLCAMLGEDVVRGDPIFHLLVGSSYDVQWHGIPHEVEKVRSRIRSFLEEEILLLKAKPQEHEESEI